VILLSTLRRLAAQGATVYRVDSPGFTCTIGGSARDIPPKSEVFSTRRQADNVARNETATAFGAPHAPTVTTISARDALASDAIAQALGVVPGRILNPDRLHIGD